MVWVVIYAEKKIFTDYCCFCLLYCFNIISKSYTSPSFLFSTQSLEWNEESTEEQVGVVSAPLETDETNELISEKKVDNSVGINEENEWDRLLRVR